MWTEAIEKIKKGGVGVIPTDTLYGLVSSALQRESVERIYGIKNRNSGKPLIVLISSLDDLPKLDIRVSDEDKHMLSTLWPGPVSVVLPNKSERFEYIHRGSDMAVRMPDNALLLELLKSTGPLVAPSANPEGREPATTIKQAKEYFGDNVDFYVDGGMLSGEPSTVISIENGGLRVIRQGKIKVG